MDRTLQAATGRRETDLNAQSSFSRLLSQVFGLQKCVCPSISVCEKKSIPLVVSVSLSLSIPVVFNMFR